MAPPPSFVSYDVSLALNRAQLENSSKSQQEKMIHNRIFSEHGGYGPSLNWYKAMVQNVNEEDEKGTEWPLDFSSHMRR